MADYIGMTPTVVIGLGGTGKEVLIKVRRMIVETYGSLDALPILSFLPCGGTKWSRMLVLQRVQQFVVKEKKEKEYSFAISSI